MVGTTCIADETHICEQIPTCGDPFGHILQLVEPYLLSLNPQTRVVLEIQRPPNLPSQNFKSKQHLMFILSKMRNSREGRRRTDTSCSTPLHEIFCPDFWFSHSGSIVQIG
uniref:Uncharacterized protein n=1 Tax=Macaca fascicularis TaxID=9541 RepID=Q9GM19_MACFA|nr:hypothetical protein [Macaca fascicularis]